jgi:curved DNA-binding protein CbpA
LPSSPPSSPPEPQIPVEEQRQISDLYADLARMDHYKLLGVSATDDVKTIKRAYFTLAKQYHPDRWFRREVGPLRTKIDAIFVALTTALETLTEPQSRQEYDSYLREVLKSRISQRRADAFEARQQWTDAAQIWARVVDALPNEPFVRHRYAYALLCAGVDIPVGIEAVQRAIELDPGRAEYRVTAASLFLLEGRDQAALAELQTACELDPERREVNALYRALLGRIGGHRA